MKAREKPASGIMGIEVDIKSTKVFNIFGKGELGKR